MFGLVKFLVAVVGLVLFVWFGANVELGSRTLFQHLQAIGSTHETKDLLEGTRRSTQPIVDGVRKRLAGGGNFDEDSLKTTPDAGGPPAEQISETDRQRLRKVLGGSGHQAR